jgi:multisubunit Na+/H+ antiporter MnhG subunit
VTRQVVTEVLLGLAVLVVALSAIGVLAMPGAYAKLHFVTPAAIVAPVLVFAAIFVREGLDENTGEMAIALVFMVAVGPFLSHATIRAIRVRERGDWREKPAQEPAQGPAARERR